MAKKSKRLKEAVELRKQWYHAKRTFERFEGKLTEAISKLTQEERAEYYGPTGVVDHESESTLGQDN